MTTIRARERHPPRTSAIYFDEVMECLGARPDRRTRWDVHVRAGTPCGWIEASPRGVEVPEQGWKLHVSATVHSDQDVLRAVLPVIIEARVPFKVAGSRDDLALLNSGKAGLGQVGKFVTVYPPDDERLVRLAETLVARTAGLAGPAIPSDRPVRAGSVVHYRYGSFVARTMQTAAGLTVGVMRAPGGEVVEDPRDAGFAPPAWTADPLVARGLVEPDEKRGPLLADRYLCVSPIHQSVKGVVYLGLDIESPDAEPCVIKQARRHVYVAENGVDALTLLRNERAVLEVLADTAVVPRLHDYIHTEFGEEILVRDYLEGTNLRAHVSALACRGLLPSDPEVRRLGLALCALLGTLHGHGVVHRDLKPANFVLGDDGALRTVDVEIAYHPGQAASALAVSGTRGYFSPQQERGEPPAVADDVYGLGALLYFLCTGLDLALVPRERRHEERPVRLLNPAIGPDLEDIVGRCLREAPDERFAGAADVAAALESRAAAAPTAATRDERPGSHGEAELYRSLACRVGDYLCEQAEPMPGGVAWTCRHPASSGNRQRDVHIGAAGIVLTLVTLYEVTRVERFHKMARRGLAWLADIDYARAPTLPGLLVGESGVGLAFLRAAQAFGQCLPLSLSRCAADAVSAALPRSPDFFNGLAGCGHFFLQLSRASGDRALLGRAVDVGETLLGLAEEKVSWTIPAGYGDLSGQRYLGFAHGSAGIGYFLCELFEVTREKSFLASAVAVGEHLASMARPALADQSGANWPDTEDGDVRSLFWCHGAAGIGQFLLRLETVAGGGEFGRLARRAGRMVARGGRWVGPTLCHGLAGNIDLLLDLYQATGELDWLAEAYDLAGILRTHAVVSGGGLTWPSEEPTITTPDLLVGCAGAGYCFARLSRPDDLPNWFS